MEPQNTPTNIAENQGEKWTWRDLWVFIGILVFVVLPIRLFIAQPFVVSGASMDPTFHDGDYVIVDQLTYRFDNPQRGDVVIFRPAIDESKFFIKRIIGLPGETVKVSDNNVFIKHVGAADFERLDEQTIQENFNVQAEWTLSDSQVFVLGDNRKNSLDSRYFGPIESSSIQGRAWLRLLPVTDIDFLPGKLAL